MFEHLFAEMNRMLDEIAQLYPLAQGQSKETLNNNWNTLKQMSDGIIEEWLALEEKMGTLRKQFGDFETEKSLASAAELEQESGPFVKGQGYFKLQMYSQAAGHFQTASELYPQSPLPLLFLAVCFVHLDQSQRASACFNRILSYCESSKLKSICCNALGCIAAMDGQPERARDLFMTAYRLDPSFPEPLANLEACMARTGSYQFESQLHTLV